MPESNASSFLYADEDHSRRKALKIGIMLDAWEQPAWVARVLNDIEKSGFCTLDLFIFNDETPPKRSFFSKLRRHGKNAFYILYTRLDNKWFAPNPDPFALVDLRDKYAHLAQMVVQPERKGPVHRFPDSDVSRLHQYDLDIIIRFGFNILRGPILECARYGIWSYHHGDNREYRGGPALFWEIHENNPLSGVILQRLTEDLDGGKLLYRSSSSTYKLSQARNRAPIYWKAAPFILRCLRQIHRDGWNGIQESPLFNEGVSYHRPIYKTPRNGQMISYMTKVATRFIKQRTTHSLYKQVWALAIREHSGKPAPQTISNPFRRIASPRGRWLADPFLLMHNGRRLVFVEDCPVQAHHGSISCMELDENGILSDPVRVLHRPYHISYPCVFECDSEIYMIPETSENRTIEIYRAVDFPLRWELERTIIENISAVDTTPFQHDGRWWFFSNISECGGSLNDELFLFSASHPLTQWRPHPMNPIVSDVRWSRSAGRLFLDGGRLVRPAQDCSIAYGHCINFRQVHVLTDRDYAESALDTLGPEAVSWGGGVHTINHDDRFEIIDVKLQTLKVLL